MPNLFYTKRESKDPNDPSKSKFKILYNILSKSLTTILIEKKLNSTDKF